MWPLVAPSARRNPISDRRSPEPVLSFAESSSLGGSSSARMSATRRVIDLVRADCAGGRMASPPAGYALSSVDGQRQSAAASYGLFGLVHAERGSGKLESFH